MKEIIKFGAGAGDTVLTPTILLCLIISIILIIIVQRKYLVPIIIFFIILCPPGQQLYFADLNIYLYRVVLLAGLLKAFLTQHDAIRQKSSEAWDRLDTYFAVYAVIQAIVFTLQYRELGAVINQLGFLFDSLGGYFLFRSLIVEEEDIVRVIKSLSYLYVLLAFSMLIEQIYMVNIFGLSVGDLALQTRDGSIRSFGSFRHPLTAGTAGATIVPLFMILWYRSKGHIVALLGLIASTIMVVTAHSSGPLLAYIGGIIALISWSIRAKMRLIRWVILVLLIATHLLMKAPVWFLIARIDLTGSSSSYHRAILVDKFINQFWEWWLLGTPNHVNWGWSLWDVQNQYVSAGVEGGLAALIAFIAIIVAGFSRVGKAMRNTDDKIEIKCVWAVGATHFSYLIAFMGVNLFDQVRFIWFLSLAILSSSTGLVANRRLESS